MPSRNSTQRRKGAETQKDAKNRALCVSFTRPDATNARPEAAKRAGNLGWIAGWWGPSGFAAGAAGTRVLAV
ncbi:Hypothetical protein A7982_08826 [Minicystis rosea]|nr:Hypothetical protein A7982_08826 [Minicystis rosea]